MRYPVITAFVTSFVVTGGAILGLSKAQQTPTPAPQVLTPHDLADQAQHDIASAQMLYQIGQLKARLGSALEQAAAKDEYWKTYVEGINQMGTTGKPPTGAK